MSICLDHLFTRERRRNYACFDFADDVWNEITKTSLRERVSSYQDTGKLALSDAHKFTELEQPESPCLVLMDNGKSNDAHIGVFYEGRVYHLLAYGPEAQLLQDARYGFKRVRFFV